MLSFCGRPWSSIQVRTCNASGRKQLSWRDQSRGPAGPEIIAYISSTTAPIASSSFISFSLPVAIGGFAPLLVAMISAWTRIGHGDPVEVLSDDPILLGPFGFGHASSQLLQHRTGDGILLADERRGQ